MGTGSVTPPSRRLRRLWNAGSRRVQLHQRLTPSCTSGSPPEATLLTVLLLARVFPTMAHPQQGRIIDILEKEELFTQLIQLSGSEDRYWWVASVSRHTLVHREGLLNIIRIEREKRCREACEALASTFVREGQEPEPSDPMESRTCSMAVGQNLPHGTMNHPMLPRNECLARFDATAGSIQIFLETAGGSMQLRPTVTATAVAPADAAAGAPAIENTAEAAATAAVADRTQGTAAIAFVPSEETAEELMIRRQAAARVRTASRSRSRSRGDSSQSGRSRSRSREDQGVWWSYEDHICREDKCRRPHFHLLRIMSTACRETQQTQRFQVDLGLWPSEECSLWPPPEYWTYIDQQRPDLYRSRFCSPDNARFYAGDSEANAGGSEASDSEGSAHNIYVCECNRCLNTRRRVPLLQPARIGWV